MKQMQKHWSLRHPDTFTSTIHQFGVNIIIDLF